jgi:hypothetical protein
MRTNKSQGLMLNFISTLKADNHRRDSPGVNVCAASQGKMQGPFFSVEFAVI